MRDEALALLDAIGLRPIMVEGLGHDALIFTRYRLALIDTAADVDAVVGDCLTAAAGTLADSIGL